jgi:hypothetical protein
MAQKVPFSYLLVVLVKVGQDGDEHVDGHKHHQDQKRPYEQGGEGAVRLRARRQTILLAQP